MNAREQKAAILRGQISLKDGQFLDHHKWWAGESEFMCPFGEKFYTRCGSCHSGNDDIYINWKSELRIFTQWKLMAWWEQISLYP